jgi:hypothetical protein
MSQQLKHIVLFAFKDSATQENIQAIVEAFANLKHEVDGVQDFEWGTNVSPENLDQGFTHCFQLTFLTEADRDAYLPHPAHKAFGALLHPHLDKVLVVDYWANSK